MKNVKGYFKVDRNIFELGLRPYCFIVYLYLMSCANRETRQCWPSMKTIANYSGISRSTVEKAISFLKNAGLILVQNRSRDNHRINNLYTVVDCKNINGAVEDNTLVDCKKVERGLSRGGEINKQKEKNNMNLNNPSFNTELDEILERAFLIGIQDEARRNYIESLITKMFYSDHIKVDNAILPNSIIRKQLKRITPDAIEFMMKKMLENTGSVSSETNYAIACLYNAIDGVEIDVDVDITRDFGYRECYKCS